MKTAIDPLTTAPLMALTLEVDFGHMTNIGVTAHGRRRIAPILGGAFEGERLRGRVLPGGADWVINRPDGAMVIDVRIALETEDKALIYCSYQGVFRAAPEVMARFNKGALLEEHEFRLRTHVRFETGVETYQWLNDTLFIGVGRQTAAGPIYSIHEVL